MLLVILFLLESDIKDYSKENIKIYKVTYKRGCPLILTSVALRERERLIIIDKSGVCYVFPFQHEINHLSLSNVWKGFFMLLLASTS